MYITVYTPPYTPRCITLNNVWTAVCNVVYNLARKSETKITKGTGPRRTIYLKKELWEDSSFPFRVNEALSVEIVGEKLVIERAKK